MLALWLARTPLLTQAGRFLDVSEPPCRSDCVLVLGGDHDLRPAVAAALYKAGLARQVLVPVTGTSREVEAGLIPPEDDIVRRVLIARGVPASAIVRLPGPVASTADEAAALSRFLDYHPGRTVTVVTTDFHTRRARLLFRRANPGVPLHFVAAPSEDCDAGDWWQSEGGCVAYLGEYIKLVVCALRR